MNLIHSSGGISAWIRWTPSSETFIGMVSAIIMVPLYYSSVHLTGFLNTVAALVQMVLAGVIFPAWYLVWHKKRPISDLGLTRDHWRASLSASFILAALFSLRLLSMYPGGDLVPLLMVNACMFWEPFFVFGWLLLCFDRAFGIIPGIVFTGAAFGAYHIGTYPAGMVVMLAGVGIFFGIIFRTTRNLLILWPLSWTVSSSIGTSLGGMVFGWDAVLESVVILIVSLGFLAWSAERARQRGLWTPHRDIRR